MRRAVLILCLLLGLVVLINTSSAVLALPMTASSNTILGGLVKTVSWADPVKGTESEILVLDASKKKVKILVTSTTTVWDSTAKAILPEKITPKAHVNVIFFTTTEGINIAKSIKVLK